MLDVGFQTKTITGTLYFKGYFYGCNPDFLISALFKKLIIIIRIRMEMEIEFVTGKTLQDGPQHI